MNKVFTIGVYGSNEVTFFQALLDAHIDTFCDIRLRRGMRGSKYAYVNSSYLCQKLHEIGILYIHVKDLAPTQDIRMLQKEEDYASGTLKSERTELAKSFVLAYNTCVLEKFDMSSFVGALGPDACNIAFFCVEKNPQACHRSLVVRKIAEEYDIEVENLMP